MGRRARWLHMPQKKKQERGKMRQARAASESQQTGASANWVNMAATLSKFFAACPERVEHFWLTLSFLFLSLQKIPITSFSFLGEYVLFFIYPPLPPFFQLKNVLLMLARAHALIFLSGLCSFSFRQWESQLRAGWIRYFPRVFRKHPSKSEL